MAADLVQRNRDSLRPWHRLPTWTYIAMLRPNCRRNSIEALSVDAIAVMLDCRAVYSSIYADDELLISADAAAIALFMGFPTKSLPHTD